MSGPFRLLSASFLLAGQLAAVPALAAESGRGQRRLAQIPRLFVATWGPEGSGCVHYPGRTVITRRSISYRQWVAGIADATPLAHNRLMIRFRGASRSARATMILTVGTTGSRLFIERSGRIIAILHHCGR